MKTVLFGIAFIGGISWTAIVLPTANLHECDACTGIFCACDVKCGPGEKKRCNCTTFACVCWCEDPKNGNNTDFQLPVVTPTHIQNSILAESYFRSFRTQPEVGIADHLKALREVVADRDVNGYRQLADQESRVLSQLSVSQYQQWETWKSENLTPGR